MKTKVFISIILLAFCANGFAQEYYYWYKHEKISLELVPTKKYIVLKSAEDTTVLKSRLTEGGITVIEFGITELNNYADKITTKEKDYWAMVEKKESCPVLTDYEEVVYEGPYFLISPHPNSDVALSDKFYVKLKTPEDFPEMERLAAENNVEIYGNDKYLTLWYVLSCNKNSNGNALQMANLFHDSELFDATEPELLGSFVPLSITTPQNNTKIYVYISDNTLYLNKPEEERVNIYSVSGKLLYSTVENQISVAETVEKILIVRGSSGWSKKVVIK
jgi:hypothetical protein